jgi:excinuclease ABC subunit C
MRDIIECMALTEDMVSALPRETGVYLLKDKKGRPVYIGKAKDLRSRLRSYLVGDGRAYTGRIAAETAVVDFILTRNEAEALLLENQLIKRHRPRYNIDLKDDKSYVRIKVGVSEPWPSLRVTRTVAEDGSLYFGPYPSAQSTRETLSAIGRIFPLRRCKDAEFRNRSRPCVYHAIGLCLAPCTNEGVRREYDQAVSDLVAFLEGRDRDLVLMLKGRMQEASDNLEFEKAARIRDRIAAIESTLVPQAVIGGSKALCDVFAFFETAQGLTASVLSIDKGALVDSRTLSVRKAAQEDLIPMTVLQYYLSGRRAPRLVYVDADPSDAEALGEALTRLTGEAVRAAVPKRGRAIQWVEIARRNARGHAAEKGPSALEEIARVFHLRSVPYRMECFDVSTLSGTDSTASCAVFLGGEPAKNLYRRFRISDTSLRDDFSMLKEVITRRLENDDSRPDLVVIDGGKAQLRVFLKAAEELGLGAVQVVAMAKARGGPVVDRFFLPGRKDALRLAPRGRALRTLQRLRDEAHRFAVGYHRLLRSKKTSPAFERIPGIGPKKARELLKLAGALPDGSRITRSDLESLDCLNRSDVERILEHLASTQA